MDKNLQLATKINAYSLMEQYCLGNIWLQHNGQAQLLMAPFHLSYDNNGDNMKLYCICKKEIASTYFNNELTNVSIAFTGPSSYIAPSWTGTQVFDWNYKVVQVTGQFCAVAAKQAVLEAFLNKTEEKVERPIAASFNATELSAHAAEAYEVYEVMVEKFDTINEMSVNREETERLSIIRELKKQSDFSSMLLAFEMEEYLKKEKRLANR